MHSSIEEILARVLQFPADQRAAYLEGVCGFDTALRTEIENRLSAVSKEPVNDGTVDFAASDAANPASAGETRSFDAHQEVNRWIGPYKLLQEIGEGGFGSVFMAEQKQPVKRRVALKIIKLGMDTRQVIARF